MCCKKADKRRVTLKLGKTEAIVDCVQVRGESDSL